MYCFYLISGVISRYQLHVFIKRCPTCMGVDLYLNLVLFLGVCDTESFFVIHKSGGFFITCM